MDAQLPGVKQKPSRPGKASNILLPVCFSYISAGCVNKVGNCFLACHPELQMVISKTEKDGHISDGRG